MIANSKFKKDFADVNELVTYQNDLVPLLLDSYEAYKLASKHQESLCGSLNNLLVVLYYQFNPLAISSGSRVSMDEIMKFCLMIERKDKASKAKPKAKPAAPQTSTDPQAKSTQPPQISSQATI